MMHAQMFLIDLVKNNLATVSNCSSANLNNNPVNVFLQELLFS